MIEVRVGEDPSGNLIARWEHNDQRHTYTFYSKEITWYEHCSLAKRLSDLGGNYYLENIDEPGFKKLPDEDKNYITTRFKKEPAKTNPDRRCTHALRRNSQLRQRLTHCRR